MIHYDVWSNNVLVYNSITNVNTKSLVKG
jgi:hypothetical protein